MDVEKRITDGISQAIFTTLFESRDSTLPPMLTFSEYHKQARDAYDLPDLKRGPESLPDPRETKKRKIQEVEEGEIVDDD